MFDLCHIARWPRAVPGRRSELPAVNMFRQKGIDGIPLAASQGLTCTSLGKPSSANLRRIARLAAKAFAITRRHLDRGVVGEGIGLEVNPAHLAGDAQRRLADSDPSKVS